MRVELLGYNLPLDMIQNPDRYRGSPKTPEYIVRMITRISQSDEPFDTIKSKAIEDIDLARKRNKAILFGRGHYAIAEAATFNILFEGLSRYWSMFHFGHRLMSGIQQSQRYVKVSFDEMAEGVPHTSGNYTTPPEIRNEELRKLFCETVKEQFGFYLDNFEAGVRFAEENYDLDKRPKIEEKAKEDLRYALPLATHTRVGATVNATALERLIVHAENHPAEEIREVGRRLKEQVMAVAPSLFPEVSEPTSRYEGRQKVIPPDSLPEAVSLVHSDPGLEELVAASILKSRHGITLGQAKRLLGDSGFVIRQSLEGMRHNELPPREFEKAFYVFEALMSEACQHQMIRHRMMSLEPTPYSTGFGFKVPPFISGMGLADRLGDVYDRSEKAFKVLQQEYPDAAAYVLPNGVVRLVTLTVNARELYHIRRLRISPHAQWEIREIAGLMEGLARRVTPNLVPEVVR